MYLQRAVRYKPGGGSAPAGAAKGLAGRPLETFGGSGQRALRLSLGKTREECPKGFAVVHWKNSRRVSKGLCSCPLEKLEKSVQRALRLSFGKTREECPKGFAIVLWKNSRRVSKGLCDCPLEKLEASSQKGFVRSCQPPFGNLGIRCLKTQSWRFAPAGMNTEDEGDACAGEIVRRTLSRCLKALV